MRKLKDTVVHWIDEHVPPVIQHIIVCMAIYGAFLWMGIHTWGAGLAIGANAGRELTQLQEGKGFGIYTLLTPTVAILTLYFWVEAVYQWGLATR